MSQTFAELRTDRQTIQRVIDARRDDVPNLRDYGFARRDEFEQAVAAYHAETSTLVQRVIDLTVQMDAARRAELARS